MCLSVNSNHQCIFIYVLSKDMNRTIKINQQSIMFKRHLIIHLFIYRSILELLISLFSQTFLFLINSHLYVLMRKKEKTRKKSEEKIISLEIQCSEGKDRKIDDRLIIRTCGCFRIYLHRLFSLLFFYASMFVTRTKKKKTLM